ncbi:hypothetical protein SYNGFB01_00110 [Synechococcus sp. GFB01]|nr:hypothetical protein SYNGFB01_00110 [Synechococcus sp. GFB01]
MRSDSDSRPVILSHAGPPAGHWAGAQAEADEVTPSAAPGHQEDSAQRPPASGPLLRWDDLLGLR